MKSQSSERRKRKSWTSLVDSRKAATSTQITTFTYTRILHKLSVCVIFASTFHGVCNGPTFHLRQVCAFSLSSRLIASTNNDTPRLMIMMSNLFKCSLSAFSSLPARLFHKTRLFDVSYQSPERSSWRFLPSKDTQAEFRESSATQIYTRSEKEARQLDLWKV